MSMRSSMKNHPEGDVENRVPLPARGYWWSGGPTGVLMVHGFAGSLADTRGLAEWLHRDGLTVAGVRLAGHGRTIEDFHRSHAADWLASIRPAVARLQSSCQTVFLVGESMGGLLGLEVAEEAGLSGVVLLAPPLRLRHEQARRWITLLLPARKRQRKPWVTPAMLDDYRRLGKLPDVTVGAYRQLMAVVAGARQRLTGTKLPVLAIFDRQDFAVDRRSVDVIRRLMPADRLTVVMVDGGQHHLADGDNVAHIAPTITAFFERISSSVNGRTVV